MIKIENFKEKHLDGIVDLENSSFTIPWSKKSFEDELKNKNAVYFVAVSDDTVMGYLGMWKIIDEADITNIAVSPQFRRSGVATLLLEHLIDYCKENNLMRITLEVRKSNTAAINLYEKFGFKNIGMRKAYYADNREDALIMDINF